MQQAEVVPGITSVEPARERRTALVRVTCVAPDVIFTAEHFADIPAKYRRTIANMNGLPCDGGGVPGEWCIKCRCPFSQAEEVQNDLST